MSKPSYLQRLDKGKLLTGNNFPEFVNTWNYTVNRLDNLKGDRDTNPSTGHITIDEADPDHPVIRYVGKESEGTGEGVKSITGEASSAETVQGEITASGAEGSGLTVTTTKTQSDPAQGKLEIDIADRASDEEYGGREITMGEETIAKVFGTTDFEITQKNILAGTGISVEETGNDITISTEASSTEGYTGDRTVVVDVDYNGHYLRKKFATETWKDGILQSTTEGSWENYHTAVEETV